MNTKHISVVHYERARLKITDKLSVLVDWAKDGVPWQRWPDGTMRRNNRESPKLIYYPVDLQSFADWDQSQYSSEELQQEPGLHVVRRFARSTLGPPPKSDEPDIAPLTHSLENTPGRLTNSDKHTDVRLALEAVKAKAACQIEELDLGPQIRKLEAALLAKDALIKVQENEIANYRRIARDAQNARILYENKYDKSNDLAKIRISSLESKIHELIREINDLSPVKDEKNS
ncbi:hypothetical protein EHZ19_16180 [Paraburkholderia bannensis]|nr:hypothetical protein [Paraburkholderia bannensis]RQM47189.1 hypothetical protein EHZ19_16180 [Paraburkholderia bannensis]